MTVRPRSAGGANVPERWQEQVEFDVTFARQILLDKGQVLPMFILHRAEGPLVIPALMLHDKQNFYRVLRLLCVIHDAVALCSIGEAWIRDVGQLPGETDADHKRRATELPPSKASDRKEVIWCMLTWRDNATGERRTIQDMREIERRASGMPTGLRKVSIHGGRVEGEIINILPARLATDAEKRAAQALLEELKEMGLQVEPLEVLTRQ
jgi:hypothetical protein